MWPFKKKRAIPYAEDLNPAEQAWLDDRRKDLAALCAEAGLEPPSPQTTLASADKLISRWHLQPATDRIDPNAVVNAAGVALGDALAAACGLEWKIVTDSYGTEMGLWWQGDGNIILSPVNSVAKKFEHSSQGVVQLLLKAMVPDVLHMKTKGAPP